jgi:hypothetical protein
MVEAINMDPFMVVPTLSKSLDHFNIETTMVTWGSPMTEANFPGQTHVMQSANCRVYWEWNGFSNDLSFHLIFLLIFVFHFSTSL